MTSPEWRRCLQPLLLTGLFCCWLLFAGIGWLWLLASERNAAQQTLEAHASQQRMMLRSQLDGLQLSARQLLRSLEQAQQQGERQYLSYLSNYRQLQPPLGQVALLGANPAAGRQLEVLAFTPSQSDTRLLPTQDLARQPVVAAALPMLQRGQPLLLLWQRRGPEQWLLLVPGQHGLTLAVWLQPQLWLPERGSGPQRSQLSALPVVPQQALEGSNLFVQLPLQSGVIAVSLTVWQPWSLGEVLGWRMLVWLLFQALLGWLGWRSWRLHCTLMQSIGQARALQQQWLAQAEALALVSVQGALATLERKVQSLQPSQQLMVWWVHGKGVRRRHFNRETAMLRLEHQLLHAPPDGVSAMRLRHGGVLLALQLEASQAGETVSQLSAWLTAVMGGRAEDAALLWQCFDVSHGVQALERTIGDAQWYVPGHERSRLPDRR
ncbi:hypothetical protein QF022_000077 [Vogesella perlucida]|nr:hypothetical protein [Vogesella perlucida]